MSHHTNRKVVIIGCGTVGTSYAYAMLNQRTCDTMILVDIDQNRSRGEADDLNHGLAFASSNIKIKSGSYADCGDADIVALCAGAAQSAGEDRISLLQRNAAIFEDIVPRVEASGFDGVYLVATNPVDVMSRLTQILARAAPKKVIGTGTMLDSSRLRYHLAQYFTIDPRNIHAYVMGEHGDSEFVPWSQAFLSTKSLHAIVNENPNRFSMDRLHEIENEVRNSADKIISAKGGTCYGVAMAMTRLTAAIMGNEHSVFTPSVLLQGEYGREGLYVGAPAVVDRNGIREIIKLQLTDQELTMFHHSCDVLYNAFDELAPYFV